MSFLSKAFSTDTVGRGLQIIDEQKFSLDDDEDTEALEKELKRLQADRLVDAASTLCRLASARFVC